MMTSNQKELIGSFLRGKIAALLDQPNIESDLTNDEIVSNRGVDSVKIINLIIQIEQNYDIMFEDDEMLIENFESIDKMTAIILSKLGVKA